MILEEKNTSGKDIVLISKDCNMRIKGDVLGIRCEDYKNSVVVDDHLYDPINNLIVSERCLASIHEQGYTDDAVIDQNLRVNDYAKLICNEGDETTLVKVCQDEDDSLFYVKVPFSKAFKLAPKNDEQKSCA